MNQSELQRQLRPARLTLLIGLCALVSACQPSSQESGKPNENTDTFIRGKLNTGPSQQNTDDQEQREIELRPISADALNTDSPKDGTTDPTQTVDQAPSANQEPSANKEPSAKRESSAHLKSSDKAHPNATDTTESQPVTTAATERENLIAGKQTSARFCLSELKTDSSQAMLQDCRRISNRLASVSYKACTAANLEPVGCASSSGFPLYVTEFPPLANRTSHGRILVIGGTHGDELTSVSVVFRWIEKLNEFHSGLFHWRIAPLMNPDGVLPKEATRVNGRGVDLNRNMPSSDWHEKALLYWNEKTNQDPRKYPGTSPASEPESKWLIDEINEFQPNAIISVHAPYGIVDFDALELHTAPKSLGKLRLNMLGTYPGSLGNYAGINRDIPVITLELPHAWVMPSEAESTRIWEDIVSWLKKNIDTRETVGQAN